MVHIPPELPEASPIIIIIRESPAHVVVAVEIAKTTLLRHIRFFENLADAATRAPDETG